MALDTGTTPVEDGILPRAYAQMPALGARRGRRSLSIACCDAGWEHSGEAKKLSKPATSESLTSTAVPHRRSTDAELTRRPESTLDQPCTGIRGHSGFLQRRLTGSDSLGENCGTPTAARASPGIRALDAARCNCSRPALDDQDVGVARQWPGEL
ncbi:hypothetical protein CGC21_26760 [Leishmania donovani]|uniref:Uncharacterized protein n=1 Tax=Leishmania donovani TaxID=5661 RepID=A0A504WWS5_LEIDO|nr:hypothetical protein CGC21_26760 [Leishmania donovani]